LGTLGRSDGSITSYRWDFGDPLSPDNTSTEVDPSHTFSEQGYYTVYLTVTANDGATSTASITGSVRWGSWSDL
jgi:PKD repeat protein